MRKLNKWLDENFNGKIEGLLGYTYTHGRVRENIKFKMKRIIDV